jgi:hypothetical protein
MSSGPHRTLDEQRVEFADNRFLAMPIAGTIAWSLIGVGGAFLPVGLAAWVLFICTGMIFGMGLVVARFLGEDLLGKTREANEFDRLFMLTVVMAWLVFAIAIPFFMIEPTWLPLTVGILAGLMWDRPHLPDHDRRAGEAASAVIRTTAPSSGTPPGRRDPIPVPARLTE